MRQLSKNIKSLFGVCIDVAGFPKSKIIMYFLVEVLKRLWDLLPTLCYYILLHMVIESKNAKILPYVLALYLVVFIVQTVIGKIEVHVRNSANAKILSLLRNIAMNKLLNKELVYTSNNESYMKCLVHDDSEQITEYFSQSIGFLCSILSFLVTSIIILVLQWKLAFICFAIIPISFWITNKVNKKSYGGYEKQRVLDVKYNEFAEDVFNNWIDIRANGIEKYERDHYSAIWKEIGENNFKVHLFWFINKTLITFKDIFATRILIYFLGGLLIVYSQFSVVALIVFVDYYSRLMNDLFMIFDNMVMMQRKQVSLNKWLEFVNDDVTHSGDEQFRNIDFEDVSFSYEERKIIDNLNLHVVPGDVVGVFGKSGMGKSTIIRLLLQLLRPQKGIILLGERDLQDIHSEGLFSNIGFMIQDPILFDISIYDNILLGNDRVAREKAKDILGALKFDFSKFPEGLDTVVGQNGQLLSGGERQKVIIARTILRNVHVLVFDEPVSALDELSRKAFYEYIVANEKNRIVIMVLHDMEAQKICNKQVCFRDEGKIDILSKERLVWKL